MFTQFEFILTTNPLKAQDTTIGIEFFHRRPRLARGHPLPFLLWKLQHLEERVFAFIERFFLGLITHPQRCFPRHYSLIKRQPYVIGHHTATLLLMLQHTIRHGICRRCGGRFGNRWGFLAGGMEQFAQGFGKMLRLWHSMRRNGLCLFNFI